MNQSCSNRLTRWMVMALMGAMFILAACAGQSPATPTTAQPVPTASQVAVLPPDCSNGITPSQTEGPYYKANTPERASLIEPGMAGARIIVAGYILTRDCKPIAGAWLDFWQANDTGEYDNSGYTLRGHQYTDNKGRYYLETIMPGLYASRPIGPSKPLPFNPLHSVDLTAIDFD